MATTVEQSYAAHTKKINAKGVLTSAEIPYIVFEAADEDAALAAVLATAPATLGTVPLNSVEIDSRENDTTYKVNAVYDKEESDDSDDSDDDDDSSTVSFDCGGGTKHLTHSIKQTKYRAEVDPKGAIGWNGKSGSEMSITGVDIPTAQLRETYTKIMKLSKITTAYKRKVANLVGKVNMGSFKGWESGEVMFLGMSYSCPAKKSTKVTVTFNFAIQPNESGVKVGDVTISKKGFEYAWATSKSIVGASGGIPEMKTTGVFVDQVCEYASFSALGL